MKGVLFCTLFKILIKDYPYFMHWQLL